MTFKPIGLLAAVAVLQAWAGPGLAASTIVPEPGVNVRGKTYTSTYRLFDDPKGVASGARFERITAVVERGGFRLQGDVRDVVLRDIELSLKAPTQGSNLPAGVEIQGSARDVLVERVTARGFQMVPVADRYTNGDGFSSEWKASRIRFRFAEAYDNSDGGFDLKSSETELYRTISGGNTRDYRIWGQVSGDEVTALQPVSHGGTSGPAYFWLAGGARLDLGRLVARGETAAPLFQCDKPATITIKEYDLRLPPGNPLVVGPCKVDWGRKGAPRL